MYEALHDALHSLQAVGPEGFEGLVQAHISRLTGQRFFLAKTGSQGGKDASTAGYGGTYIDIECKRYGRGKSPTTRDLSGGLIEAIRASGDCLDLWLVVSTGAIGSTEAEALRQTADRESVAVGILDWQEAELPQLALLCAAYPDETLAELRPRGAAGDLTVVARDLATLKNDPRFSGQLIDLKLRFSAGDLGLDHARTAANAWIETRLARNNDARAAFNQSLCIGDSSFHPYVERAAPQGALDAWYSAWPANPSVAAVLGQEGSGKSWSTMAWWTALGTKPLTLIITSNKEIPDDAEILIASALASQTRLRNLEFWRRRVDSWLHRSASGTPALLLILDGLNERPGQKWDCLFASLAESRWAGHLAVAVTCRPAFWSERVARYLPMGWRVTQIQVSAFNDAELARAWANRQPSLSDMPSHVRDFIRTPRICRLAGNHVGRLIESGDLTVERLLIVDWQDRRELKPGFRHSEPEFNNIVIALARDLRHGAMLFGRHQLSSYSSLALRSPGRDLEKDFDEIIEGQLFEPLDPVSDRYRVRRQHVGLALGMLLAQEVHEAYQTSGAAGVEEVLAAVLEPLADLRARGWDEQIKARMPLYHLTPAGE
jgi:hypothetical protein